MKTRLTAVVLAVVCGVVVAGRTRADDAKVTGDLKMMQGTWVRAGDEGPECRWIIEGESLKATVGDSTYTCTLTLDPKATPVRSIDLAIKEGPGESVGKTSKGIYNFEKGNLVLCVSLPGGSRPTEFKSVEQEAHLFVLKQEK